MPKLRERKLQPVDLTKVLGGYENQWVALSRDHKRVLGAGKTLAAAEKKARKSGKKYLFLRVLPFSGSYVPTL